MPFGFWVWVVYLLWLALGAVGVRYAAPISNVRWVGYGSPIILALLLFMLCWAVAGNPAHTLVRGG